MSGTGRLDLLTSRTNETGPGFSSIPGPLRSYILSIVHGAWLSSGRGCTRGLHHAPPYRNLCARLRPNPPAKRQLLFVQ
jgi:hypothetical protein